MNCALLTSAIFPWLFTALGASPNLLDNSGFERGPVGWQIPTPPGGNGEVDATVAHSGQAALRIFVPASAPVTWHSVHRPIAHARREASYTLSAYVHTRDVRDGVGVYISMGYFNAAGERLGYSDSNEKVHGSADWRRLTVTGRPPAGTSQIRATLILHGHGTVWFDDVQLEDGLQTTTYGPSYSDVQEAKRLATERADAAAWLHELPPRKPGQARIAVLDEKFPAGDGCPSDPHVLVQTLSNAGHAAVPIDVRRLANPEFLISSEFDLLVIPTGDAFPAHAHRALVSYLSHGGLLLTTGGYAFDRPLVNYLGSWTTADKLPLGAEPTTALTSAGSKGWNPSCHPPRKLEIHTAAGPHGTTALEIDSLASDMWDSLHSPNFAGKLPKDWSVTRFWAQGDAHQPHLFVEWTEADGSRWQKLIPLSTEWQEYVVYSHQFSYRADSRAAGRGGSEDHFRPAQARHISFSLSVESTNMDRPHTARIADVRVQADAAGELRTAAPHINTRWARIRDAMWPNPEQIGAFDSAFPLRDVARTHAVGGQNIVAAFDLAGPLCGYSATAMLGLNGHGFGPNRARWVPLLECVDRFDRSRGHAGAIIHQFQGTFAGSSWAVFGVTNRDLFATGSPGLQSVLLPTVAHLLRRTYLHETDTALGCYRAGETVLFRTHVSNFTHARRALEVRFNAGPHATLTQAVDVLPGQTVAVEVPWKPAAFAADYYPFAAELWESGRMVDREENAFVAWNPAVIARGTPLRQDGTRFRIDGRRQFLMGCQTYWGQNPSVTARSPAAVDRDFRQMRDFGLRWVRCFLPFVTEEDKRTSDVMVQLAQKYGLILYHTPNLHHTADPTELARQQATAREIAERYRGVPGMAVDICNEPSFKTNDPGLEKHFGRPGKIDGRWDDLEVAAFWHAMADAERAWEKADVTALHAGDPGRLASVGWSQGWGGGLEMKDPLRASLELDFTDRHYYGPPAKMPPELKDLDLRGLGKPLILGECGAKNHPTFKAEDPWHHGDDDDSYDRRFLSLGHHALGLGAAVISVWHWRDPMEGIFPCGIVHQTNVPRPTALLYRAMALAFGRLKPVSVTPSVYILLSDEARQGGQRAEVVRAQHRAAELLIACGADFGLLPDSALDRLPAAAKAIVYPVPMNPSDAVVERLSTFVAGGGSLLLSGDINYNAQRHPIGADRLRKLCGVERVGEPAAPFHAISVKPVGAEIILTHRGAPTVTRLRSGKGQSWFAADPIELAAELSTEHRDLYRQFLDAAGVPRLTATPDSLDLHVFRVPGEDADALVLHNAGPATTAGVSEFQLQLAADGAGYLLVGHDGTLRAVEAQGAVVRAGQEVAHIEGHAFLVADDDTELARSRLLWLLPLAPGEIRLTRSAPAVGAAEVGEMRDGRWSPLAKLPVKSEPGCWTIVVPTELRREMIRVQAVP